MRCSSIRYSSYHRASEHGSVTIESERNVQYNPGEPDARLLILIGVSGDLEYCFKPIIGVVN